MMTDSLTDNILLHAIHWAKEAGKVQLQYFRNPELKIDIKSNISDVVTQADKLSEGIIINGIHTVFPGHSILSEESSPEYNESDYCWVIDPLDGTTNFSAGLPQFCVSIGVKYKGETIVGVVFAPYLDELYTAVKGEGAYLNGKPIHCSSKTDIHQAVVSTGFPYDKDTNPINNIDSFLKILPLVRGIRCLGAAAIDICSVANGCLDAYWELNLHEWDVCAGILIAQEAGAESILFREDRNISLMVANRELGKIILPLLS